MNSHSFGGKRYIVRLDMVMGQISFGTIAGIVAEFGGDIVAIDVIQTTKLSSVRDLTVTVPEDRIIEQIIQRLESTVGVRVVNVSDRTFLMHLGGKIEMKPKIPILNRDDLSHVYTPEVARVCKAIHEAPQKAFTLTIKKNTVAVVSDGSAVLGLGNLGALPAMPVMEGKAMLFKQLADVDAFPICLNTQDPQEIVNVVKAIAPAFGGINLEDIAAPNCFWIEEQLKQELDIPVFHDDQHGTAVVLIAGLMNALKLVNKSMAHIRVVINGMGAAGTAIANMLYHGGVRDLIGVDRVGIIDAQSNPNNPMWEEVTSWCNPRRIQGGLAEAVLGADVLIGVSAGNAFNRELIQTMASDAIVFAMANPTPEIHPDQIEDLVAVIATGRSDFPNQINNVLCFPGMFRATLDCRAKGINDAMKLAAAEAIASVIPADELNASYIIPSVFNPKIVPAVRVNVIKAAIASGIARRIPPEFQSAEPQVNEG